MVARGVHPQPLHRGGLEHFESLAVEDLTEQLAADTAKFNEAIDRRKFLQGRYQLDVRFPVEKHHDTYLPYGQSLARGQCGSAIYQHRPWGREA